MIGKLLHTLDVSLIKETKCLHLVSKKRTWSIEDMQYTVLSFIMKWTYSCHESCSYDEIIPRKIHELVDRSEITISQMTMFFPLLSRTSFSFLYHRQNIYRNLLRVTRWMSYLKKSGTVDISLSSGFIFIDFSVVLFICILFLLYPVACVSGMTIFDCSFGCL